LPSKESLLLAEAARLGFKAWINGDEVLVEAPDSYPVAGKRVRIKVGEDGYTLAWGRGGQDYYKDPRRLLQAAYNLSSQLLFKRISSTALWAIRVLESYRPEPKLEQYHREVVGLRGDPRLLLLSASITNGDSSLEGLERLPGAGRIISALKKRLSSISSIRHSRLGLYASLRLAGLEPWTALAGIYHASHTLNPRIVVPERDPLSLTLSWEASWIASACLEDSYVARGLLNLVPPLQWECGGSRGTLNVSLDECPYPCFRPVAGKPPRRLALEGYVAYMAPSGLMGLLLGVGREAIVRLPRGVEGPYDSLRIAWSAREEEADRRFMTGLLIGE